MSHEMCDALSAGGGLRERFAAVWAAAVSGGSPDVFEFLHGYPNATANDIAGVLLEDQSNRQRRGAVLTVERYFEGVSPAALDESLKLELIVREFMHAESLGQKPDIEAWIARFPDVSEPMLRIMLETPQKRPGGGLVRRNADDGLAIRPTLVEAAEVFTPAAALVDASSSQPDEIPRRIGRYRIERVLGSGGFGCVYLAYDDELVRPVAIKVPHERRVAEFHDVDAWLAEARVVAALNHPGVVKVFDAGRLPNGAGFVVSQFIEGGDLAARVARARPTVFEAATWVAAVAETLNYIHNCKLVHRDIKPGNLLVDSSGCIFLTDFGLALRDEDFGKRIRQAGTPAYMSPEQARGEGHLVDGRSDLFSLGVVMYELLAGTRPFKGDSWHEMIERIKSLDVKPLRQLNGDIPKELERICLKALAKRASERYATGKDLADELQQFLREQQSANRSGAASAGSSGMVDSAVLPAAIIPRGLRSFDSDDADFFLRLLPGPYDREGTPERILFWKSRIETPDADKTFRVGLMYGPSGCGKSSLMKAGLLPLLSRRIIHIYIEAAPDVTEARLLAKLQRRFPDLPPDLDVRAALKELRRGRGLLAEQKLLIVIDQFEQWLHGRHDLRDAHLVETLRQCDGEHVQCIVMVRDDFWMGVTEFFQELDIPLIDGQNSAATPLFDMRHARKVLMALGSAYGALPPRIDAFSTEQVRFLDDALTDLAEDGRVVTVRLSLFAEMVKSRPWSSATLKALGGAHGVGAAFLEETFSAPGAPPQHRRHQRAARAVLRALLPEAGSMLKGRRRGRHELLAVSGYGDRPAAFDDLIRILDTDLHMITPAGAQDPQDALPDAAIVASPTELEYQLTHDYLVPALTTWLNRQQMTTRRGRAELRLAERATLWNSKPERKQLPTLGEWMQILRYTGSASWSSSERQLMRAANRYHSSRVAVGVLLLATLGAVFVETSGRIEAAALRHRLLDARIEDVPEIVRGLPRYRRWLDPLLRAASQEFEFDLPKRLRISLALLPVEPARRTELLERMLSSEPQESRVISEALRPLAAELVPELWKIATDVRAPRARKLRADCALVAYTPDHANWPAVAADVATNLVTAEIHSVGDWSDLLRPIKHRLVAPLYAVFISQQGDDAGGVAANVLASFAGDDSDYLCRLAVEANRRQLRMLISGLQKQARWVTPRLVAELARTAGNEVGEAERNALARRQSNAALALLEIGAHDQAWRALRRQPDPSTQTRLIHEIAQFGMTPHHLIDRLEREPDAGTRQALLLSLGEFSDGALPPGERSALRPRLLELFRDDPDSGVHSAAEWLLRRWGAADDIQAVLRDLQSAGPRAGQNWYVNLQGQTLAVIRGPVTFSMGFATPNSVVHLFPTPHVCRIDRDFAIAAKEVTVAEYTKLMGAHQYNERVSPNSDCPINQVPWHLAIEYCRKLSEQEGISEDQMCYPRDFKIAGKTNLSEDFLQRTGYRLATEAEWEYACRAGTITLRPFGDSDQYLSKFAWFNQNSSGVMAVGGLLKPNPFGLFDMLGNAAELCHDEMQHYPAGDAAHPAMDSATGFTIDVAKPRIVRGGGIANSPDLLLAGHRMLANPAGGLPTIGFRIVKTLPRSTK